MFEHDGNLHFETDSLNTFARCDEIVSATNLNAYERISSSCEFLDLNGRIVLFTSSAVISRNTNKFFDPLMCCKVDDVVLGIKSSKRLATLEK